MCIVHIMWLTLAKLISLYLFSVNMRGKLCNIDLITRVFIHTPRIAPVSLLITLYLSTILSTHYPQGFYGYQQVQGCPVCITCVRWGYTGVGACVVDVEVADLHHLMCTGWLYTNTVDCTCLCFTRLQGYPQFSTVC